MSKVEIYIDYMLEEQAAGVLLALVCEENCSVERVLDTGIPMVCFDRRIPGEIDTDGTLPYRRQSLSANDRWTGKGTGVRCRPRCFSSLSTRPGNGY